MKSPLLALLPLLLPATLACSGTEQTSGLCAAELLPGDLVITEVLANPTGDDAGREWFEVYNATTVTIDLTGVRLMSSRDDGTSEKVHTVRGAEIAAGQYLVVGGVADADKPDYVDYGASNDLGTLRNTTGRLAIKCNQVEVDAMQYTDMASGVAQGLDGSTAPDYTANDDANNWCDATAEYETDSFGSPGAANPSCGGPPMGGCDDGGTQRPTVPPVTGDLVITEYMADPSNVSDSDGEWFELLVITEVDLNGLQLGSEPGVPSTTLTDPTCLRVTAGTTLLFAKVADSAINGGLPPVDFVFSGFSLANSSDAIVVEYGGELLDQVNWTSSVPKGTSVSLDPGRSTPMENDDAANWCAGRGVFNADVGTDEGTPGASNGPCLFDGTCLEGEAVRPVVPPTAGDLVITEYMANPNNVSTDSNGEWFEVLAVNAVDLNGLQLGQLLGDQDTTITDSSCLVAEAGSYLLFARNADSLTNGGLPPVDVEYSGMSLTNSSGSITLEIGGQLLDTVQWSSTVPVGKSVSLDPDFTDESANDTEANWCEGTGVFAAASGTDEGTPAAANPQCPQ